MRLTGYNVISSIAYQLQLAALPQASLSQPHLASLVSLKPSAALSFTSGLLVECFIEKRTSPLMVK